HESVIGEDEIVAVKVQSYCEGEKKYTQQKTQEPGFERRETAKVGELERELVGNRGEPGADLPGSRGEVVDQSADNTKSQHDAQKHRVERKVEQVKRKRAAERRVAPGLSRQRMAAKEPYHRPRVDEDRGEEETEQKHAYSDQARVDDVVAKPRSRRPHSAGV